MAGASRGLGSDLLPASHLPEVLSDQHVPCSPPSLLPLLPERNVGALSYRLHGIKGRVGRLGWGRGHFLLKGNRPHPDTGGGILVSMEGLTFREPKTVRMGDTFLPTPTPPRSQSFLVAELGPRPKWPPDPHQCSFLHRSFGTEGPGVESLD